MTRTAVVLATLLASGSALAKAPKYKKVVKRVEAGWVAELLRAQGHVAEVSIDKAGDPQIAANAGDFRYHVLFYDCTEAGCTSLQFRAYWGTEGMADPAAVNQFVNDVRIGRGYLDVDNDPTFEVVVPLIGGVTWGHVVAMHQDFMGVSGRFAQEAVQILEPPAPPAEPAPPPPPPEAPTVEDDAAG